MSKNSQIPKPTVVVVENNPSACQIYERMAEKLCIDLYTYHSAEESLEFLNHNTPDLLFLTIILPDKDGLTFLKDLRNNPIHTSTSVVMVTSKDYAQDRTVAEELGAIDFLIMPVAIQAITDVVSKHTGAIQISPN